MRTGWRRDRSRIKRASTLRNVRLLYGSWAYRLGTLNAGQQIEVGEELSPRSVKTIVTRDALGESGATAGQVGRTRVFGRAGVGERNPEPDDVLRCGRRVRLCAFAESLSGVLRFEPAVGIGPGDPGRRSRRAGAQLVDDDNGRSRSATTEMNPATVVYRFVLPVKRAAARSADALTLTIDHD